MKEKKRNRSFTFIDLFAGIGGLRIPFEETGGKCVFSSEWNQYSQITYEANFEERPSGELTLIDEKDIPQHDVLLAGFPCQPFSQAGLKKGFADYRGTMFSHIARILQYHKPAMVLLENVKGLKHHNKGKTLEVISLSLQSLHYSVHIKVLNARDFGVPQNRARIFIVALHNKKLRYKKFSFPKPRDIQTKVGDILEKKVASKYTLSEKLWLGHRRRKAKHKEKGNGFGYGLFTPFSKHTNTLSARYYKDGAEILIKQKGGNPRRLTPREAARLQGFQDRFSICVSDTQAYQQFGNAVTVPVVRAIANKMVRLLSNE